MVSTANVAHVILVVDSNFNVGVGVSYVTLHLFTFGYGTRC